MSIAGVNMPFMDTQICGMCNGAVHCMDIDSRVTLYYLWYGR